MTIAEHAHFNDYSPTDFGWANRDPERDSSLLVPFSFNGVSFGSMNRDVVGVFTRVLTDLVPKIPGGLVAGQCGCYNPRSIAATGTRSFHSWGIAIDVNWGSNPMGVAAHPSGKYALPLATSQIANKYGCEWGGDWASPKDWMHIECHLSPADARAVKAAIGPDDPKWSDTVTKDEVTKLIDERILTAQRAVLLGGDHDTFTHEKFPKLIKDEGEGVLDRLNALEHPAASK